MRSRRQIDYSILVTVLVLVIFGLVILASASSDLGKIKFDNTYYYLSHQLIYGLSFGALGFFAGLFIPYRYYKKAAPFLLLLSIGILIAVFTPLGLTTGGAERWLTLGPISFQPSELLKISFVVYLAAWLSSLRKNRSSDWFEGFLPFLMVTGLISILLVLQRSTSSVVIILFAAIVIYFISGAKKQYLVSTALIALFALGVLITLSPYRLERVTTYLNPASDIQSSGYQINRSLITIGSGGLWGVGYGKSVAKSYLPERIGDSIFAIIAEEFGFVGSVALIFAFLFIAFRTLRIAERVRDRFGKLIVVGFGSIICLQAFMHIGATSGLIPLTGVPLPFISFGGTAMAVFLTMTGIMLNISKNG